MSADKMPPVVGYLMSSSEHPYMVRFSPSLVKGFWDIPLVTEAAARAYAAEQTRELVEVLKWLDSIGGLGTTAHYQIRRVLAKHKEQP
jgi:hypothetical protein